MPAKVSEGSSNRFVLAYYTNSFIVERLFLEG
jgi:hypothetical protein